MAKIVGYILALIGVAVIILSSKISTAYPSLKSWYVIAGGVVLAIVGIAFLMQKGSSRKVKHAEEEVPIYQGEGKKRRIVGYRMAK